MQKAPTSWKRNPAKNADAVSYSSPLVTYNSTTTPFSSATTGLAQSGKVAGSWSRQTKSANAWNGNAAAITNLYTYNSVAKTYDSAVDNYDGIVVGQEFDDTNSPTPWSVL